MKMKEKIDSKQWIPIYGVYRAIKDDIAGKPSVLDGKNHPFLKMGNLIYQTACIITASYIPIGMGTLEKTLLEKILK